MWRNEIQASDCHAGDYIETDFEYGYAFRDCGLNDKQLIDFFETRRARGEPLAMVTVYDTEGSTYSKHGARLLVDSAGVFRGMLSGGCLEGDLAVRASSVIDTGRPHTVTYDLTGDDDELWGMGVGCEGLIRVLLQPLTPTADYQPFAAIADVLAGERPVTAAVVIESGIDALVPGTTALLDGADSRVFGADGDAARRLRDEALALASAGKAGLYRRETGAGELCVLCTGIAPPPRLLVAGAGLDAEPVLRFATELGWRACIYDHRPAYIENGDFGAAESALCGPADELAAAIDLSRVDLVIVMSHHLASDRAYLRQVADSPARYVGLLGPPARRARLVAEIGDAADRLEGRLHGPAGLDIGGRGPAAIALSIVAGMQQAFGSEPGAGR